VTPKPPPLPAACTECTSTLQLAAPGSPPSQIPYNMARSATGQMRIDYGTTSVITNPATGMTTLLDHAKMEARTIPTPPGVAAPQLAPPGMPGMPGAPTPPATPATSVKDLGIKMVQGVEVQGKQYTMPPLAAPAPPPMPGMPGAPGMPGMPGAPAVPGLPGAPKPPAVPQPTVVETWVSTKLQMPVLTRITGSFGQSMCHCKNTVPGEPPPSTFQIPPNYKQIGAPGTPAPPVPPAAPGIPSAPAMPGMSGMPSAPAMPAPPAMPSMPTAPKPPTFKF